MVKKGHRQHIILVSEDGDQYHTTKNKTIHLKKLN